jgi:hypothetical protein
VTAAAHGAVLTPKFHGVGEIDIFGERVSGALIPPARRPYPNSPVFLLESDAVAEILGLDVPPEDKPFRLGLLDGNYDLEVQVPAARKGVLFKHLAILGTTGGGKSTTVSGLLARMSGAGNAVIVFDVEGEYTTINEPANNEAMKAALKKRGLIASGIANTKLFVLDGRQPSNPKHPSIRRFKIAFDQLSPFVLAELLDLSEAQNRRFFDAYEVCRILMERLKIYPATPEEQNVATDIDELERGWPKMTLRMLIDVVGGAIALIDDSMSEFVPRSLQFKNCRDEIKQVLTARKIEKDARSWKAIAKRLWRMLKAGVFGDDPSALINATDLMVPGQVSIIDLSDMDAPYLRNLVIAQMLRALQDLQDDRYRAMEDAERDGKPVPELTRVNIVIEEAHEFLSSSRIQQMPTLFEQVARIARRGRKRYIGLVFVTQLPGHLPDEVLGLMNNWILHKLTDTQVIQRLRKIVPSVHESTWGTLPNLSPGRALCSFAHLARPVMTSIDPSPCRLRMVD